MKFSCLLLGIYFCFAASANELEKTKDDTNREVIRTYARVYLEAQAYEKADALVSDYLTRDPDDGNLWVLLGQTQTSENKLAQACYSFQKASTLFKDLENKLFAEYSFADCLNRGGRTEEAKAILKKLAKEEVEITNASAHALELIEAGVIRSGSSLPYYQKEIRGKWHLSAAIASGFDSNVILVDENVMNDTSVSDRGSFFFTPAVQARYGGRAFGDSFDSRYVLSYTKYLNQAAVSFNSISQRVDFSFGSGPIRWGVFGDALFLNRNPFQLYEWEGGLSYLLIKEENSHFAFTWEIPLRYQKYILDVDSSPDNDRTGEGLEVKANARWTGSPTDQLNLQVALDGQVTKGKNYRLAGIDIPLVWMIDLPFFSTFGFLNTFTFEVQGQTYFQSDTSRRDFLARGGLGLVKVLSAGWNLNLDYTYQKNRSTVEFARYTKNLFSLQLSHEFL